MSPEQQQALVAFVQKLDFSTAVYPIFFYTRSDGRYVHEGDADALIDYLAEEFGWTVDQTCAFSGAIWGLREEQTVELNILFRKTLSQAVQEVLNWEQESK